MDTHRGVEVVEGLVHPPLVQRQVTAGAAEEALAPYPGGRRREPETDGLAASREHEEEEGGRGGRGAGGAGPHRRRFRFAACCVRWWDGWGSMEVE